MKYIYKTSGEKVTGRVVKYKDKGRWHWIPVCKKIRFWINKLDGELVYVKDGVEVDKSELRKKKK